MPEKITYKNKYGYLEFDVVGEYQDVTKISSKRVDAEFFFDISTAEKIALITNNKDIQLCFTYPTNGTAFLVHHKSSGIAAVCRITKIEFDNKFNATKELEPLPRIYLGS